MCAVQCTSRTSSLGRVHAHYTDACESTYESKLSTHFQKHLCIVHWKPNIDQNLKVSKFVKQTRDKQDIRGKNREILERKNKQNQPNDVTLYIVSWESKSESEEDTMWLKAVTHRPAVYFVIICSANVLSTSHSPLCVQAPTGSDACLINRFQSYLVKLKRAQGGCLGTKSRRKTW